MNFKRTLTLIFAAAAITAFAAACGSSSSSNTAPSVYNVQYIPGTGMNAPTQGKTTFQLKITKNSDGSAATGLNPTLAMTMHMVNGSSHSTPADIVSESTTTPGTYNCTVYYLMASGPTMGTWEMKVTAGGETTTFNPDVAMAMGSDTIRATLYGSDDMVTGMSGTSYNKYYMFRDGPLSASTPTLKLYISHGENMMMDFKAVSAGSVLSSGTVTAMTVQASSDGGSTWHNATDNANGHWSVSGFTNLVSSQTNTIYVKLNVNTEDKTTDGNAMSGSNDYATFAVTPGM